MFYSVLYPTEESAAQPRQTKMPEFFGDLQLDRIMRWALQEAQNSGLEEIFYTPTTDPAVVTYRQDIMKELEDSSARSAVQEIVQRFSFMTGIMDALRAKIDDGGSIPEVGKGKKAEDWLNMGRLLEHTFDFTVTMRAFCETVRGRTFRSEGLRRFADYVASYCESPQFLAMEKDAGDLRAALDKLRYCLWFKTNNSVVKVLPYEEQEDYVSKIENLFARFRQGDVRDFRKSLDETPVSEHLENEVLRLVARLEPELFKRLKAFCSSYIYFDEVVLRFASEARFYFAWLDMMNHLREAGLSFCYPTVSEKPEKEYVDDCFDLSLALNKAKGIVTNSFVLAKPEQILVVTGPNQGGKSTFARSFGQVHYLASLGLAIPGRAASLPLCDKVMTHFEREEKIEDQNGKLRDDLIRLKQLMDAATPCTAFVINEIFASTTAWDALILGRQMMEALVEKGGPAVVVTFLEELSDFGPQTVSMTSEIPDKEKRISSFRITRKEPGGLNFAMRLAERHELSYEAIKRRVQG